jgi:hypothetical protein
LASSYGFILPLLGTTAEQTQMTIATLQINWPGDCRPNSFGNVSNAAYSGRANANGK